MTTVNLIELGATADEERRRRHGAKTTFVRVLELHFDAVPDALPAGATAGELRIAGRPATLDAAVAAVRKATGIQGAPPLTAFSTADLADLATASGSSLDAVFAALAAAGLARLAECPIDGGDDPIAIVRSAKAAGLEASRLTVHGNPEAPLTDAQVEGLIARAVEIQSAVGGVRAFAPLPRVSSVAHPSTGYDDVTAIARARLGASNIDSIQVDWSLYGPKLAQVALTMGADDVDGVSPLEGNLGRRRSPIEEIKGNITAAGLDPVERQAW
ncbi:MAG TPA: hypothetical protein VG871_12670 [Vicinamibacterales bacterium]|nr:hypothetical protein [Vicinamibacterales bacterium]